MHRHISMKQDEEISKVFIKTYAEKGLMWHKWCFSQLQQQLNRLMKINHDLRHKITVVEAQGKALIEQKVELEASGQARQQEMGNLRQEVARLKERLKEQGKTSTEREEPVGPPSPAQVDECRQVLH